MRSRARDACGLGRIPRFASRRGGGGGDLDLDLDHSAGGEGMVHGAAADDALERRGVHAGEGCGCVDAHQEATDAERIADGCLHDFDGESVAIEPARLTIAVDVVGGAAAECSPEQLGRRGAGIVAATGRLIDDQRVVADMDPKTGADIVLDGDRRVWLEVAGGRWLCAARRSAEPARPSAREPSAMLFPPPTTARGSQVAPRLAPACGARDRDGPAQVVGSLPTRAPGFGLSCVGEGA
jgi:hypothetical protein